MRISNDRSWRGRLLLAAAAASSAALAIGPAAAASAKVQRPHAGGAVPSITRLVPAAIKHGGVLTVATDATYAPNEFIVNGRIIGMDPDIMHAIAATMGLKLTIKNVTFDDIIPSMLAGRFMIGASSYSDTKTREKQVNFVDDANVPESFYTNAKGGTSVKSINEICGLTVAAEEGTTEAAISQAQSKTCVKAHRKAVNTEVFPTQNEANLAVSARRAQLGFADGEVAAYQVHVSHGQFKLVGAPCCRIPSGLAVAKSTHLAPAVKASILYLMRNGTYTKIFRHWDDQSIAVKPAFVKITG